MADDIWKGVYPWVFGRSKQLSLNKFFDPIIWNYLGISGPIWDNLGLSGTISCIRVQGQAGESNLLLFETFSLFFLEEVIQRYSICE